MRNRSSKRWAQCLGLVSLFAVALTLATPSARSQDERFGDTSNVVLVQIPVYATKDGIPVRGLTADNFVVTEGKKKQPIVAVDMFDLTLEPSSYEGAPGINVPAAGRRHFVMLFDLSNSLPSGIVRARDAALELVENSLHPTDLAAVATYSKDGGIELLLGFTNDRAQLAAALNDLGLSSPFARPTDPLKLQIAELSDQILVGGDEDTGRRPDKGTLDKILLEHLKDMSVLSLRPTRDQVKQQILDLSNGMDILARLLDSASGRKQVILFSQGFDSEVVFGTTDQARIAEIAASVNYSMYHRVDSEERFGASDAQNSLLLMLEDFNRSDCAVHTVDVGGLTAGGEAATQRAAGADFNSGGRLDRGHDGLALMANETGGEFYRNFNDLTDAMDDLLERTSVTYVVSIQPEDVPTDGAYHPLKVRLKGTEKGIKLSHRPGYFARRPYSELSAEERQLSSAEQIMAGVAGGSIGTAIMTAPFPSGEAMAYVLTALEIDGNTLIADQPDNMVPTEIFTYAFDEQGQIRDSFSQAVMLDLYKVGYRLDNGFKLLSHLALPHGRYEIRSLVRNAATGATGLAVTHVEVPVFEAGQPVLLPPFFMEPDDHWLVGREDRAESVARPYPLMNRDTMLVPAIRPQLVSGRDIPVLLVGHNLPDDIEAGGHLVGPDGRVHEKIDIEVQRRAASSGESERLIARLYASGVRPGEYQLIVTVRGGGLEASSAIPVEFLN